MTTATTATILDAALELHDAGLTVLPLRTDGSKSPAMPWKQYQTDRPTRDQVTAWFRGDTDGLGILTGAAGNIEMFELEGRAAAALPDLAQLAKDSGLGELWERISLGWLDRTPSGGIHWHAIVDGDVPGNTKLARRPATPDELAANPADRVKVLAETRGAGGFTVVAPSHGRSHPTGQPWVRLAGGPSTVARITAEEREAFCSLLRTLDDMPAPEQPTQSRTAPTTSDGGLSPLDDFEARTDWADILTPHGWKHVSTRGRTRYWRRPGKDDGFSATTGHDPDRDRLYVFTTSTEFDAETPYTKPGALAVLEHGGDHSAAARDLRRRGYGAPPERATRDDLAGLIAPTVGDLEGLVAPDVDEPAAEASDVAEKLGKHHGQARLAYRLAQTATGRLLHVYGIGWHAWDGTRWAFDDSGAAKRAVLAMLRGEWRAAMNDAQRAKEVKAANSAGGVDGILSLAAALEPFATTVRDLDADPYLLNVANGTLNLRTMQLRPHDPADRITKVTTAAYAPDAAAPVWEAFLERVLPDAEVRTFVQRYAGLALAGRVLEHRLAIFTGPGRNGKGTFYGAVSDALGDYAKTAEPDLFMARENAHTTGEMDLLGVRWVVVSESDNGRRLAEAVVKRLTGGDKIRARRMRQDFVEFTPSHTPVLVTNHLPKVHGDDPALWARLCVVPFDVVIPEDERDPRLAEKLAAERDAILTWAVAGWADYDRRGRIDEPDAVKARTDAYRADSDALGRFISDRCITGPNFHVTVADLWSAWVGWCKEDGSDPGTGVAFGKLLTARGHDADKVRGQRIRRGLALQQLDDDGPEPPERYL